MTTDKSKRTSRSLLHGSGLAAERTTRSRRWSFILLPVLALTGLPGVARGSIPEDPNPQQWVARYNGPGNDNDYALSLAVAPDGSKVFVTGSSQASNGTIDYATVAYSTTTGAELWAARYSGPDNWDAWAYSLAVAPDGSKVFVTGWRGARVSDLLRAVGARPGAEVLVESLQPRGSYRSSKLSASHAWDPDTLIALEVNGEALHIDHGFPARLVGPNRPGVMQTKWIDKLVIV